MAGIDKNVVDKLKLTESNVNVSLKSMKDGLNHTISNFNMQIKDVLADNRMMTERVKIVIANWEETNQTVSKMHTDLLNEIQNQVNSAKTTVTTRIDNLIKHNLTIPGVIEDPEGKTDGKSEHKTLKDFILASLAHRESQDSIITVSYQQSHIFIENKSHFNRLQQCAW